MEVGNFNDIIKLKKIADELGKEEILCQLSEECSELIQACLKYRRATKGLTPKTEDETLDNMTEEIGDVLVNIRQVLYLFSDTGIHAKVDEIQSYKVNRWYDRTFISENKK